MSAAFKVTCVFAILTAVARADVDFDTQIVPVLSKAACNAAACHGGAAGRGGFRLSLFGGDPEFDYRTIVRELEGRRVNLAEPHESLLLAKPLGRLEHGGEKRFDADCLEAKLLLAWIEAGARRHHVRTLERLDVDPPSYSADAAPAGFQLRVHAQFDDSTSQDVTALAVYESEDDSAVTISSTGEVSVLRPGRHVMLVRYGPLIAPLEVTTPMGPEAIDLSTSPRHNWIDDEILATLAALRLPPSPQCDDATFLRRVHLDLTGRLPSPQRALQFLADASHDKRERLIDELLASDEYVEYWTYRLARLLRLRPPGGDEAAGEAFYQWLRQRVRDDAPWDATARALLTVTGDSHEVGAATFHRLAPGPREQAEYVSETLMGVRLRCANCHNHPLDRWTQDDYHGLAQIFARLERGRVVQLASRGEVSHPRTGEAARPRIPGEAWLDETPDSRAALADWLTDSKNPYFARAMVGRIWRDLMGRGLVEPVDDLRATNPPTHPALFNRLADDFVRHSYSLRHTIRLICRSAAYARSSRPLPENRADDRYYAHALVRPLDAEVLADAIGEVTGVYDAYDGQPAGTRAITLVDTAAAAATLDVLGRCDRSESCDATPAGTRGIAAKLHLLNGPLLNRRLGAEDGRLQQAINAGRSPVQIVEDFYVRALSRQPAASELQYWQHQLEQAADERDRYERLEDFVWTLFNSTEFVTNH